MEVKINLSDMAYRVEHGFHLNNEEARWLLAQVGAEVPRKKRCNNCDATGLVEVPDAMRHPSQWKRDCVECEGSGFLPADPVEYDVKR